MATSKVNSIIPIITQIVADCKKIYIHTGQQVSPNADGTFSFTLSALIGKMPSGTKILFTGCGFGTTSVSAWCRNFDSVHGYIVGQATTGTAFRFDLIVLAPM